MRNLEITRYLLPETLAISSHQNLALTPVRSGIPKGVVLFESSTHLHHFWNILSDKHITPIVLSNHEERRLVRSIHDDELRRDLLLKGFGLEDLMCLVTDFSKQCLPAIANGMGVLLNPTVDGLGVFIDEVFDIAKHKLFSPELLIKELFQPGVVTVLGIIGHTGAGKSTVIKSLLEKANEMNIEADELPFDIYHTFTRQGRKERVEASKNVDREEKRELWSYDHWYAFEQAYYDLLHLRQGNPIDLKHMHDQKSGVHTKVKKITPDKEKGHIIIVHGVGVHRLPIDRLALLTAHPVTRAKRVVARDSYKPPQDSLAMFSVDEYAVADYLLECRQKIDLTILNEGEDLMVIPMKPIL